MQKPSKNQLYQRQITLKEVGDEGQDLLQKARILIVGCGGLGSTAAVYLAASGIGNIHLIDFDVVSVSNLHRQVFFTLADVGKPKTTCLKKYIESISPFVKIDTSEITVQKSNIETLIQKVDIVVDCTDQLHTKYLLNDACVLHHKTLVYGSLHKFDGYIATFNHESADGKRTTNLRDAFPEIPEKLPPTCSETGTLNPIVGMIALLQANEVMKIILKKGNLLTNKLFIYNSLYHTTQTIQVQQKFNNDEISDVFEKESYTPSNCEITTDHIHKINAQEFWDKLKQVNVVVLSFSGKLPENKYNEKIIKIPYFNFDPFRMPIKPNHEYILICLKGTLSYDAALAMVEAHPTLKVYNLENGVESLI
jgi:adenylyltransferase/sulfurtransferase